MMALLDVRGLRKHFGPIAAVDGVSFAVERGSVLGFLGPNGAGKTTTMRMIAGFLAPDAGTAIVCGADVGQDPVAVKRRLGYLPEGAPLYVDMTPSGFLDFVAAIRGVVGIQRRRRIAQVVERMHLSGVMHQRIETLSKGYRRRVALAQALLHDPDVLILDEPTDGLDPNQKHEVRELIRTMAPSKAIVISTHILEEVDALCDRAIIIARGRIVADDRPDALRARSDRHNAVTLRLAAAQSEAATVILQSLPIVARVDRLAAQDGVVDLLVLPTNGRSIAGEIGAALHARQIETTELHSERGRLDDVFRSVTMGSSAVNRRPSAPKPEGKRCAASLAQTSSLPPVGSRMSPLWRGHSVRTELARSMACCSMASRLRRPARWGTSAWTDRAKMRTPRPPGRARPVDRS